MMCPGETVASSLYRWMRLEGSKPHLWHPVFNSLATSLADTRPSQVVILYCFTHPFPRGPYGHD